MPHKQEKLSTQICKMRNCLIEEFNASGEVLINYDGVDTLERILNKCFNMAIDVETANQNNENYLKNADLENVTEIAEIKNRNVVQFPSNGGDAA